LKWKQWAPQYASNAVEWWRNKIYTDEVYLTIESMPQQPTIRRKLGAAFEDRNLAPTFKGDFDTMQFLAGFSSTGYTQLVPIRQRQEQERESNTDRLGLNSTQYVNEIFVPHVLPLYEAMGGSNAGVHTIEDGASNQTSA
jgi:hypothetical protein